MEAVNVFFHIILPVAVLMHINVWLADSSSLLVMNSLVGLTLGLVAGGAQWLISGSEKTGEGQSLCSRPGY